MEAGEKQHHSLAPFQHKEYRLFIANRFFYTMALRMVTTVVAYKLFQLTQTSFSIGILGLSEFVPVFSLALYAGHVIDKSDKRTLLLKTILAYSLCVLILLLITAPSIEKRLSTTVLELTFYITVFLTGVIRAFVGPTNSAIISQLVPRNILQFAANINTTTYLSASILGHASAGFLIAGVGVHGVFYFI